MPEKPTTAAGYAPQHLELVRATCLHVATKLGDLMEELVVVGGLVPSLIIDQNALPEGAEAHVGTTDLDLGLTLGLLDQQRYTALTQRLRQAGFTQDVNEHGNPTRQRWKIEESPAKVTVDFLIQPVLAEDRGGNLRDIEPDFAAVIAPGLHLAFTDRIRVPLSGRTILGEDATREVWVCGPGAYIVLKALAFSQRGENKDAYDLFYVIRNFEGGPTDVARSLCTLLPDESALRAVEVLRNDFLTHNGVGPRRVAEFIEGSPDEAIQADVVGFVAAILDALDDA